MTDCRCAYAFVEGEPVPDVVVEYISMDVAILGDHGIKRMWVAHRCVRCRASSLNLDGERWFRQWWLNLCRALVPVAARIALDRGLKAETEEQIAMMALAHKNSIEVPGMWTSAWTLVWGPGPRHPRAERRSALRCRFCKDHVLDPAQGDEIRMHFLQCALRYWATEVCT